MLTPTSVLLTFSALSSKTANFPALKWRTVSPSNLHLSAMPLEISKLFNLEVSSNLVSRWCEVYIFWDIEDLKARTKFEVFRVAF